MMIDLLDDLNQGVAKSAACALGQIGRIEARPMLAKLSYCEMSLGWQRSTPDRQVFVGVTDPAATSIVERLDRPSGNVGHVAVHGRDKYLNLLACGGVALGSQRRPMPPRIADGNIR